MTVRIIGDNYFDDGLDRGALALKAIDNRIGDTFIPEPISATLRDALDYYGLMLDKLADL